MRSKSEGISRMISSGAYSGPEVLELLELAPDRMTVAELISKQVNLSILDKVRALKIVGDFMFRSQHILDDKDWESLSKKCLLDVYEASGKNCLIAIKLLRSKKFSLDECIGFLQDNKGSSKLAGSIVNEFNICQLETLFEIFRFSGESKYIAEEIFRIVQIDKADNDELKYFFQHSGNSKVFAEKIITIGNFDLGDLINIRVSSNFGCHFLSFLIETKKADKDVLIELFRRDPCHISGPWLIKSFSLSNDEMLEVLTLCKNHESVEKAITETISWSDKTPRQITALCKKFGYIPWMIKEALYDEAGPVFDIISLWKKSGHDSWLAWIIANKNLFPKKMFREVLEITGKQHKSRRGVSHRDIGREFVINLGLTKKEKFLVFDLCFHDNLVAAEIVLSTENLSNKEKIRLIRQTHSSEWVIEAINKT